MPLEILVEIAAATPRPAFMNINKKLETFWTRIFIPRPPVVRSVRVDVTRLLLGPEP